MKYRRQARSYLARLPGKTKTAIISKWHEIASDPDGVSGDIDVLKDKEGFRLRVGSYRIMFTRQDDQLIIEVVKVRPKGDIYKR